MPSFRLRHTGIMLTGFMMACLPVTAHASYSSNAFNVIHATVDTHRSLTPDLNPGDWLQLAPGIYNQSDHALSQDLIRITNLHGEQGNPIVISGPDPEDGEAVFESRTDVNTVVIENSSYVVLRNIRLDGTTSTEGEPLLGMALRGYQTNHNITLENLHVHDYEGRTAIAASADGSVCWHWTIRHNVISNASTGLYLGHWQGDKGAFIGGLIESNVVADTWGYNMQIKHQTHRNYPGAPTEPQQTIIRHNIFRDAGQLWDRPNVLVGHFPLSGTGSDDRYLIYSNLFFENGSADGLLQGEGHVVLYNNLFFRSSGTGASLQNHNDKPKRIHVLRNTFVTSNRPLRIINVDTSEEQLVSGNAFFSDVSPSYHSNVVREYNCSASRAAANTQLRNANLWTSLEALDLRPSADDLDKAKIDFSIYNFTDLDRDYTGGIRLESAYGAYAKITAWQGDDKTPLWWVEEAMGASPSDGLALTVFQGYLLNQSDLDMPFKVIDIGLDMNERPYVTWLSHGPAHGTVTVVRSPVLDGAWLAATGTVQHVNGTNVWTATAEEAANKAYYRVNVREE